MVRHLHGRGFSLDRLKENVKLLGVNRIKNKSYVQIFQMGMNELADDENNNEEDDLGIKKDEVVVPLEKKLKSVEEDIDIGDLLFQQSEEDNDVDKKLYAEEEKDKKDIINNEHLNSTANNVNDMNKKVIRKTKASATSREQRLKKSRKNEEKKKDKG
eukprot:CAMPEP_0173138806 /NCGR_PEP_ID=MMETSP1105-20130129/3900_1 /TAXON_ID=2985 /ORGANISM="Ochromonas sp., Strain BG-1" /LENGTH=157 /DNA_ID=CAMNT_0014051453 /DNA_START=669 /DNA_END=1141 /DNA_ORIENTATION=-